MELLDYIRDELNKRRKSRGLRSMARITGKLTVEVFGPDGVLKQRSVMHNIVTNEGDALIADLLAETPVRTKVDGTTGYIEVGTGYVGGGKSQASCVTPTGSPELMDAGYPQTKGAWAAANDNVSVYKATFEAGDLNASGIDEAALINGSVAASADALAYAEISPSVNVGAADTLAITWELSLLGS